MRLPFDFLLNSLARECGARTVCVVLSGTGADGSVGLKAVKAKGGLVIAQDVGEADYDGMPQSAIATGDVDLVLPAAKIAEALVSHERGAASDANAEDTRVRKIPCRLCCRRSSISCARRRFTTSRHYKHGTLERRVERRMAMAAIKTAGEYLDLLLRDANERDQLSRDLLINVTGFFRDAPVFDFLEKSVIPDLVRDHDLDRPLRVWVAGCSSGEETYSLAMLFREQIDVSKRDVKLQVFASDVDPDAVAIARDGLYPQSIEADVSPARLAAFFTREDHSYRVSPELRASVVFTVQDVLADPPFARLDFVSCRNLLIYLRPEAQAKVAAVFHFALREGGLLLLGNAEAIGAADGRFAVVSKPERLYRRVGGSRFGDIGLSPSAGEGARMRIIAGPTQAPSRQAELAELCRRDGVGDLRSRRGADQPQARMSPLPGTHRSLSQGRAGPPGARFDRHGARRRARQAEIGRSARAARQCARRNARRADQRRSRRRRRSASSSNRRRAGARTCCWCASSRRRRPKSS